MEKDEKGRDREGHSPVSLNWSRTPDSRVSFLLPPTPCSIHNVLDERDSFSIVVLLLRMAQCRTALCRRPDYSAKTTYTVSNWSATLMAPEYAPSMFQTKYLALKTFLVPMSQPCTSTHQHHSSQTSSHLKSQTSSLT